ncbi:hypothetical protein [Gracilibacillus sp. YIM 98692]|uniref:hypothetical protein n=1 Tax=Gracilibacillus sp. YIM 98692 TaxID=2663532 RepID=UPI0013D015E9|nr:hypothetical protein [Gracilibacillus sp. YIM 98692]
MNNKNNELMQQLIRNSMRQYTDRLNNESQQKDNNSFIFLENNTLNMLMTYMFMHLENQQANGSRYEDPSPDLEEISLSLDSMIEESKAAFEEMIDILKERT